MRFILLMMVSVSAMADINITPPTKYDDDSELLSADIKHYEICISNSAADVCDRTLIVKSNTITASQLAGAYRVKAKTVDVLGLKSVNWSEAVVLKYPLPPGLTITISISVNS